MNITYTEPSTFAQDARSGKVYQYGQSSGPALLRLEGILKNTAKVTELEIIEFSKKVLADARAQTPVATGDLKGSTFISSAKISKSKTVVTMGYEDWKAPFVHEDFKAKHGQGGPKFLENAMNANIGSLTASIKKRIRATRV